MEGETRYPHTPKAYKNNAQFLTIWDKTIIRRQFRSARPSRGEKNNKIPKHLPARLMAIKQVN